MFIVELIFAMGPVLNVPATLFVGLQNGLYWARGKA